MLELLIRLVPYVVICIMVSKIISIRFSFKNVLYKVRSSASILSCQQLNLPRVHKLYNSAILVAGVIYALSTALCYFFIQMQFIINSVPFVFDCSTQQIYFGMLQSQCRAVYREFCNDSATFQDMIRHIRTSKIFKCTCVRKRFFFLV